MSAIVLITSPEWAVGLGGVAAVVTDEGGMLLLRVDPVAATASIVR